MNEIGALLERLRDRVTGPDDRRFMLGIAGAPGSGKSTLADFVAERLGSTCVIVPMDGFHLAQAVIDGTPLRERRGAIDTFDVGGYLSLLRRLRARDEAVVYAPAYRRGLEEPIAAAIAVPITARVIVTEGSYLLAHDQPWVRLRSLLDETWFVETPRQTRITRLVDRHIEFGMRRDEALAWANGPDEVNARFVETTQDSADRCLSVQ